LKAHGFLHNARTTPISRKSPGPKYDRTVVGAGTCIPIQGTFFTPGIFNGMRVESEMVHYWSNYVPYVEDTGIFDLPPLCKALIH
jgi:hypothetical protein